jgi:hypothetical protein
MLSYGKKDALVRFIIDLKNRDVYIWDANMATHASIEAYLYRHDSLGERTIQDMGKIWNNKIDCPNIATLIKQYVWCRKYFQVA